MDKNKMAVALFDKLAHGYQEKYMDVALYHDTLDWFCENLPTPNATILELACGPGNITKYLLEQRPDFKILGTDLAPKMIELAAINNPTAQFQLLDCRKLAHQKMRYDGIVCGFCLPYLEKQEVLRLILDASATLTNGGMLYLSTMEDDYEKSGLRKGSTADEIYMHYYPKTFLVEALQHAGFKILKEKRQEFPEKDGSQTVDLILIAQK